jgi:hypothetical protein
MNMTSIPKIAVLATGLAAAILVGTNNAQPAQASPSEAANCVPCHAAGGSLVATPSLATVAPGASYTVALAFTGGTGAAGSWITGNGASVTGSGTSATMTAPAVAGSYTYTAWVRQGVAASSTYTITVAGTGTPPAPTDPASTPPAPTDPASTPPAATDPASTPPAPTDPASTPPAATDPATTPVVPGNGSALIPVGSPDTGAGGSVN